MRQICGTYSRAALIGMRHLLARVRYSKFHSKFQFLGLRAFQRGKITFPGSTGCKMAGRQSSKCETRIHIYSYALRSGEVPHYAVDPNSTAAISLLDFALFLLSGEALNILHCGEDCILT